MAKQQLNKIAKFKAIKISDSTFKHFTIALKNISPDNLANSTKAASLTLVKRCKEQE